MRKSEKFEPEMRTGKIEQACMRNTGGSEKHD